MVRNLNEIIATPIQNLRTMGEAFGNTLRVACPGIITAFNSTEQTVTVQLALREHMLKESGEREWQEIPLLLDVPIVIPHAGGYSLTMPVKSGDECLVIFSDSCIDAWFTYGGVQNQMDKRRHDLSDGFAILGVWSQPNRINNYSIDSCQLRNKQGNSYIEIKDDAINIVANSVKINGLDINKHIHSTPEGSTSGPY